MFNQIRQWLSAAALRLVIKNKSLHRAASTLVAAALVLGSVGMSHAAVLTFNSSGTASFSGSHTGSFKDSYTFSLSGVSDIYATVSGTNIRSLSMDLYNAVVNNRGKVKNVLVGSGTTFSFDDLAAGNYFLRISGNALKKTGGSYTGSIQVTAVPEPEMWAMMLIGMGLIGYQVRRKSKAGPVKIVA